MKRIEQNKMTLWSFICGTYLWYHWHWTCEKKGVPLIITLFFTFYIWYQIEFDLKDEQENVNDTQIQVWPNFQLIETKSNIKWLPNETNECTPVDLKSRLWRIRKWIPMHEFVWMK